LWSQIIAWSTSEFDKLVEIQDETESSDESKDAGGNDDDIIEERPPSSLAQPIDLAPSLLFTTMTSFLSLVDQDDKIAPSSTGLTRLDQYVVDSLHLDREAVATLGKSTFNSSESRLHWARARLALVDALSRLVCREWRLQEEEAGTARPQKSRGGKALDIGNQSNASDATQPPAWSRTLLSSIEARLYQLESRSGPQDSSNARDDKSDVVQDFRSEVGTDGRASVMEGQLVALSQRVNDLERLALSSGEIRGTRKQSNTPLLRSGDEHLMRLVVIMLCAVVGILSWLVVKVKG
jgi:hypothetical protein